MKAWWSRRWAGCLLFALLGSVAAQAQVGMKLEMNRKVYLQYEPMYARVTFRNDTGKALVFGEDPKLQGKLQFDLVGPDRRKVALATPSELPLTGFVLDPGETREILIPVSNFYPMPQLGRYSGHAYISHPLLKDMFKSNDVRFEVNPGVVVYETTVGKPDVLNQDRSRKIEERTYRLKRMTDGAVKYYYLVIEDAKRVYAVLRVGRELGMEGFKCQVDNLSNIHLLLPVAPKIFRHLQVSLDGRIELQKFYKNDRRAPNLIRDAKTGRVLVIGGLEAQPGVDFELKNGTPVLESESELPLPQNSSDRKL